MIKNLRFQKFFRLFGLILFIYILSRIDLQQLLLKFKEINLIYFLIAILFLILSFFTRALRWKILINSIGVDIPFSVLAEILAKGILLGTATPGKLGEFWQAKYLTENSGISGGKAFFTTFADRLVDILVMVSVAILGILVIYFKFGIGREWKLYLFISALFLFSALIFLQKIGVKKLFNILIKFFIPLSLKEKTNSFLNEFQEGFRGLNFNLILKVLGYGSLYYLGAVFIQYFITLSLGIIIPFWYLFLIVAIICLISIIPITVAGVGLREASFIYFFSIFGISDSLAVATSLLVLFFNILLAFPGAILFLKKNKTL